MVTLPEFYHRMLLGLDLENPVKEIETIVWAELLELSEDSSFTHLFVILCVF